MTPRIRDYNGLDDLRRMKALVSAGGKVSPHSGYPHVGELGWWVFYPRDNQMIKVWEDDGQLIGWMVLEPPEAVDIVVLPHLNGTALEAELLDYADSLLTACSAPDKNPYIVAWADAYFRRDWLTVRGYVEQEFLTMFQQDLDAHLPVPVLPEGFRFLETMRPEDVEHRADVHFDAFSPSRMTPEAYARFMTAPNYDPALDVTVAAPDGRFAAFAMCWIDPETQTGIFEPVGTRSDMQRRGLGRAALYEGMRRMRARGMTAAHVLTETDDPGNMAFYQSAGFQPVNSLLKYEKKVGMTED